MTDAREHLDSALIELQVAASSNFPAQRVSRLMAAYGEAMVAFVAAEDDGDEELAEHAAEIMAAAEDGARGICAAQIPSDGVASPLPNPEAAKRSVMREIDQI